MEKLLFEEICFLNLVPNTRYFIAYYKNNKQSHRSAKFLYYTGSIAVFTEEHGYHHLVRIPWTNSNTIRISFHPCRKYYAVVSQRQKIQENMEQRALLFILKNLIDESFT
jgi:hypothetical protein